MNDDEVRELLKGKINDALWCVFVRLGQQTPEFNLSWYVQPANKIHWSVSVSPVDTSNLKSAWGRDPGYYVYLDALLALVHIPALNATGWNAGLRLPLYASTLATATALSQFLTCEAESATLRTLANDKRCRVFFPEQHAMEHFQYFIKYGAK